MNAKSIIFGLVAAVYAASAVASAPRLIPSPPTVAAKSWILMDANSGEVITEHNADEKVDPASLTKLMTSYAVSHSIEEGYISNKDVVQVSKNSWAQNPKFAGSSLMWIEPGKPVTVEELHRGVVVSSGNDASVALAEYVAGTEKAFADLMNQHAQVLGMKNTHFVNSHGLSSKNHYTTTRDLAILSQAILQYPKEYALYSVPSYVYNGIKQVNRNGLLRSDPTVDGLKTGYTRKAGYCLAASAKRDDMRLISIVMGAKSVSSREQETQGLLAYGFRFFESVNAYAVGDEVKQARIWKGAKDTVSLGVEEDVWLTIPRGHKEAIVEDIVLEDVLSAPVKAGDKLGELVLSFDGKEKKRVSVVALEDVEKGSIFKQLMDAITLIITALFAR